MSPDLPRKDLILLVADKNMEASLRGLLSRSQSLKCRPVTFDLYVHPERDPGCLLRGHDFLRPFASRYERALVLLDHEGCGREAVVRSGLESELEERLGDAGWGDRAAAVVISPELENWVWSDSPHIDRALGWTSSEISLRDWLMEKGFLSAGAIKPLKPKEAVEVVLRTARKPRSSSIYLDLAKLVGTDRCTDPAFQKLRRCLQEWFPLPSTPV
ncbi:MAG TPA: hypothetical protein VGG20_06265 [Thermoanaerobaculia bacterium]|jgi:hypothetical protein